MEKQLEFILPEIDRDATKKQLKRHWKNIVFFYLHSR
jgi:hypothetical protein